MRTKPQKAVKAGLSVEREVMERLNSIGIKTRPAPGHSPYDLELTKKGKHGTRIEVKARLSTSEITSDGRPSYRFILCRPGVCPEERAEYFILYIKGDLFIIPSVFLSTTSSLSIPWPVGRGKRSKWAKYYEYFDCLR